MTNIAKKPVRAIPKRMIDVLSEGSTDDAIAHLLSLGAAATGGVWDVPHEREAVFNVTTADDTVDVAMAQQLVGDKLNTQRMANAEYIAACGPDTLLPLLQELLALRKAASWAVQVHRDSTLSHEKPNEEWLEEIEQALAGGTQPNGRNQA